MRETKNAEIRDAEEKIRDLMDQNGTLKHTMSTLNGIFKGMQDDVDGLREANLREANTRMQVILKEQAEKLELLQGIQTSYKSAKHLLKQQENDIEELRAALDAKTNELEEQRNLAQQLMESQGARLAKMESLMSKVEPGGENPEEAQNALEKMARESLEASASASAADGNNVLCIRCRKSMAEARQLDEFETTLGDKMKRLPCASFRVLLPNMLGFRPKRSVEWVVRCCRAIMIAKMKQDTMRLRKHQLRTRMPEFVYSWFAPRIDEHLQNARSKDEALAEADEHRWGFYYGLKDLHRRLPEIQLFYEMLDETHGEDDCTFFLYNVQILQSVGWEEMMWDTSIMRSNSYVQMDNMAGGLSIGNEDDDDDVTKKEGHVEETTEEDTEAGATKSSMKKKRKEKKKKKKKKFADIQWISQETAVQLVEQVMAKAIESDRDRVILRVLQKAKPARGRLLGMENYDPEEEGAGSDAKRAVDMGAVIVLLMGEYREEQNTRKASVRLMFKTALAKKDREALARAGDGAGSAADDDFLQQSNSLDIQQFNAMLQTLNADVDISEVAQLYRDTFEDGTSKGVSIESFLICAERYQFFSTSLRLPPYYAAAAISARGHNKSLTITQKDEMRDIVYSHFCLFRGLLDEFGRRLHPVAARRLERLQLHFLDEVDRSTGQGIIGVDGQRLLCAYRRILNFLRDQEMQLLEECGEKPGLFAVKRVALEISQVESMLTRYIQEQTQNEVRVPMEELSKIVARVAASRICHRWKLRQESHPLTIDMRKIMTDAYVRGSGAMIDVSRHRRLVRRENWMVLTVYDIVGELYGSFSRTFVRSRLAERQEERRKAATGSTKADEEPSKIGESGNMNSPYEPPELCQFIHDHFHRRYGSLALGEIHLHDFFNTMKARTEGKDTNGLAKVFYDLASKGRDSNSEEMGESSALRFFLHAIAACCQSVSAERNGESAETKSGVESALLMPLYDPVARMSLMSKASSIAAVRCLFPEQSARSKLLKAMKKEATQKATNEKGELKTPKGAKVDFCKLIWLMMETWKGETRRRSDVLRARLQSMDPSGSKDVRTFLRSFCAFSEVMSASGILQHRTERFKVNLYQSAIRKMTTRSGESIMRISANDATNALVYACRLHGLIDWDVAVAVRHVPANSVTSAELLRFAWLQYSVPIAETISRIDRRTDGKIAEHLIESAKDDIETLRKLVPTLPTQARSESVDARTSESIEDRKRVRASWKTFRRLMESLRISMKECALGNSVPDHHAIENVGGYANFFR
eukprot:g5250.t1